MDADDFISKTQRKRQMRDLQEVGEELVKLSAEMIARLDLPEALREAVLDCKHFTKHEAIRRQMQYIGRIMRDLDTAPIAAQLAAIHAPTRRQSALFHLAERWRQDMMADPESIQRFVAEFPEADALRLRELVAAAQKEHAAERPPRHFRELFHVLNGLLQDSARRQS
jgi:ribosome-associated protein